MSKLAGYVFSIISSLRDWRDDGVTAQDGRENAAWQRRTVHRGAAPDSSGQWRVCLGRAGSSGAVDGLTASRARHPLEVGSTPPGSTPAPQSQAACMVMLWTTLHGFAGAALAHRANMTNTPNGEARAGAVTAAARQHSGGKPVRDIVATHHHWDHLGGIRTAIDEGATIVAHGTNRAFLHCATIVPPTITPDRLAVSNCPPKLETVGAEGMLTDGARTIKLYLMVGFEHTADLLLVYLPNEKVLVEADAYPPPETPHSLVID